jgi:DNA invertase Pin-like site-specific DNA recombinase
MKKFVAYYRVSTQQQGRSGLGIDAQRTAIATYVASGAWLKIAQYEEHESGKGADALSRPLSCVKRWSPARSRVRR